MTVVFDTFRIECFMSGAWRDLTPDVLASPPPTVSGIGISGTGLISRVGDVGRFDFSLDNSASNSAGVLGYYTPFSPSASAAYTTLGWRPGLPVRIYMKYDGIERYKYYGKIEHDGLRAVAGKYGPRWVTVRCSNWMRKAAEHTLNLMAYTTNKRIDQAVPLILANMTDQPQQVEYHTGQETFPDVFDLQRASSKAIGELEKLTFSEMGYTYLRSGETLVVEDSFYRSSDTIHPTLGTSNGRAIPMLQADSTSVLLLNGGGSLLLNSGGSLLLNDNIQYANFDETEITDMRVEWGRNMYNRVKFVTYPRKVDAAATTVLWSLENPTTIAAGETLREVRGQYNDPSGGASKVNGIEMVSPVATTDYQMFENEDGSGTDYTSSLSVFADYGTAEVRYTLTNNAGVTAYITKLQARGKGVYVYDTQDKVYNSRTSQSAYGIVPIDIQMPYLGTVSQFFSWAGNDDTIFTAGSGLLGGYDIPEASVESLTIPTVKSSKATIAFLILEPGYLIKFTETMTASSTLYNTSHFINGYGYEIIKTPDGVYVNWHITIKLSGRF